ncbi:helix-turn-helix transcriptional regulator [Tsukamurella spumae]|uniref:helix-turn-helix transcriptional regulator n=1 Tax=Tsukamurella spumae TaxID=44753 RepID=UPI0031D2D9B4
MTDVLGAAISKARRQQRMTQAHLAERAGVSRHVIGRIERGHPLAEVGIVLALIDALNLTITVTPGPPPTEPQPTHED